MRWDGVLSDLSWRCMFGTYIRIGVFVRRVPHVLFYYWFYSPRCDFCSVLSLSLPRPGSVHPGWLACLIPVGLSLSSIAVYFVQSIIVYCVLFGANLLCMYGCVVWRGFVFALVLFKVFVRTMALFVLYHCVCRTGTGLDWKLPCLFLKMISRIYGVLCTIYWLWRQNHLVDWKYLSDIYTYLGSILCLICKKLEVRSVVVGAREIGLVCMCACFGKEVNRRSACMQYVLSIYYTSRLRSRCILFSHMHTVRKYCTVFSNSISFVLYVVYR